MTEETFQTAPPESPSIAGGNSPLIAPNDIRTDIAEKLTRLPTVPGVYLHKNSHGDIIYVGKAVNLRNRVRSYFQENKPRDAKTRALVSKIADFEIIVTDNEVEALILENTLIKEHKPRYNILLKDDKTYPYICITAEEFPRLLVVRRPARDGSKYFGPYTDGKQMNYMLKAIKTLFPIRSCDLSLTVEDIAAGKFKDCLDYQIGKCEAPCVGRVSREEYNMAIRQAAAVLKGKTSQVEKELEERMQQCAEELRFEEAARLRNRLSAVQNYSAKQKVITTDAVDRDVMAVAAEDNDACAVIFKVRDGKLIGKQHFYISNALERTTAELLQSTFERFYLESEDIPKEILLPVQIEGEELLCEWLRKKAGIKVELSVPQIGDKAKIIKMVAANAQFLLKELQMHRIKREQTVPHVLQSLQRDLRLSKPPRRLECFDNSHFQGAETVSSLVVFVDGKPKKSEYRKYKNKTVDGVDDFKSMEEVIRRRYSRMIEEKSERPDLIIVDGGKGQLSSAVRIMEGLGLTDIPIIGLAKRLEEVFFPGESEGLLLPKTSSSLRILQQIRDEAHRFAITFHRALRDKRTLTTALTTIPGIGEKKAQQLLIAFGSMAGVRTAAPERIEEVVGKRAAAFVADFFAAEKDKEKENYEEK